MLINGEWLLCDDGIERPVIYGEILSGDGSWRAAEFLVDIGADRTILSANVFESLNLPSREPDDPIGGVGGIVESAITTTQIRLTCDDASKVLFHGDFTACVKYESLDMSVLGRDIMKHFAVIVDQPGDKIALLRERHSYHISKN